MYKITIGKSEGNGPIKLLIRKPVWSKIIKKQLFFAYLITIFNFIGYI
jgi:hypothetical protein